MKVTRGSGFLEGFLAKKRARIANKKIPNSYRQGKILDIGCGNYPYFLSNIEFNQKYGLDKSSQYPKDLFKKNNINFSYFDIENFEPLPFADNYFKVVTMLAVIEHIHPNKITKILSEVYRILQPDGIFILTIPASLRAHYLLKIMASLKLVSLEEIKEHKYIYNRSKVTYLLIQAGFENIHTGYFEFLMNIWTTAKK